MFYPAYLGVSFKALGQNIQRKLAVQLTRTFDLLQLKQQYQKQFREEVRKVFIKNKRQVLEFWRYAVENVVLFPSTEAYSK